VTRETIASSSFKHRERSFGSLTQQVVQELGIAIVTGKFSGDRPFPTESEICGQFGASRSIVREAIKVLNAKGLLSARPRRGTHVRPEKEWNLLDPDVLYWMLKRRFSLELLIDFTRARLAIEPAAAAEAARTASEEQQRKMQLMLARMEQAAQGSLDPLETDVDFHLAILEASNNQFFYNMSPMIETALNFSIRFTNKQLHRRVGDIGEHAAILNAILARDPERAAAEARNLLERALATMKPS
jgi:DNA-binding FadR family transcriptional regulator